MNQVTRVVKLVKQAYQWFWYHTEFWIDKTKLRRPYTYIFRDHPWAYFLFVVACSAAAYLAGAWWARTLIISFVGILTGHVWWGSAHIPGQQESPDYDPWGNNDEQS
jgi:hypothetical protein